MKNIEGIKKFYSDRMSQVYYGKIYSELDETQRMYCDSLSEYKSYLSVVLPRGYSKFSIWDLDGYAIGRDGEKYQTSCSPEALLEAKDKICDFCWGVSWVELQKKHRNKKDDISAFIRKNGKMHLRKKTGNNVIISSSQRMPAGRTMVASLIMKEAIRLRITQNCRDHSYDWIDMDILVNDLSEGSPRADDCKYADWLVIDNIFEKKERTPKHKDYIMSKLNPFLFERFQSKLVTIFVFKYDIRDRISDIENQFGITLSSIVSDSTSYSIFL